MYIVRSWLANDLAEHVFKLSKGLFETYGYMQFEGAYALNE